MTYTISCVLLIPTAHRADVNQLAEALGYGPDNLSVPLVDGAGGEWFGCHTWCAQSFLDQLADPEHAVEALTALVVSSLPDGDSTSNWAQALADNGLRVIEDQEQSA